MATTMQLTTLNHSDLQLIAPIPIHVKWSAVTGAYAAYEDWLGQWIGLGATAEAAVLDLQDTLCDIFLNYEANKERLSTKLMKDLDKLQEVISRV